MNKKIISCIVEQTVPEKIILFGSQAQGANTVNSDIDLLVLIKDVVNKRQTAQMLYKVLLPFKVAVDLIIDTPENYAKYKKEKSFIYYQIDKTGKTIYERNEQRTDLD
jgi:predicted nucleotidyltransferase